jgi:hypothetical protein
LSPWFDIVRHLASIDHEILLEMLGRHIPEPDVMQLIRRIVVSGDDVLEHEHQMVWFAGDDLLACDSQKFMQLSLTSHIHGVIHPA